MISTVDKKKSIPAYQQIREILFHKIKTGEIKPGEKLPSENQLCRQYGISRITVRQAVASLVNDALLHTVPGKGTFANDVMQEAHLEYISSFIAGTRQRGLAPSISVIEEAVVDADCETAENLNLREGEKVIKIKRVKAANNIPLYIELRYIPHRFCPDLVEENLSHLSLTELAKDRYSLDIQSRDIVVMPFTLDEKSALLLKTDPGLASLIVIETLFLEDGSPFKWEKRIHKSGLHFTTKAIIRE